MYWNGSELIPEDTNELINYSDDAARVVADPLLGDQNYLVLPRWNSDANKFADDSITIRQAFEKLVLLYAKPLEGSSLVDAANPTNSPIDDIIGNPRLAGSSADIGAYEVGAVDKLACDLNLDNAVDVLDMQICVNVVIGVNSDSEIVDRADVNKDSQVDSMDLQTIVYSVLGG
jgi:hypothetical protein